MAFDILEHYKIYGDAGIPINKSNWDPNKLFDGKFGSEILIDYFRFKKLEELFSFRKIDDTLIKIKSIPYNKIPISEFKHTFSCEVSRSQMMYKKQSENLDFILSHFTTIEEDLIIFILKKIMSIKYCDELKFIKDDDITEDFMDLNLLNPPEVKAIYLLNEVSNIKIYDHKYNYVFYDDQICINNENVSCVKIYNFDLNRFVLKNFRLSFECYNCDFNNSNKIDMNITYELCFKLLGPRYVRIYYTDCVFTNENKFNRMLI